MSIERQFLAEACRNRLPQLSELWDTLFADGHPHYLDVSTEKVTQVAYSPEGVAPNDHKRRRRLTLGRYLARQHKVDIDAGIECGINGILADLLSVYGPRDTEFTILRGEAITEAYVKGVGCNSCMTGEERREISEWFSLFPDKIGLLVWNQTEGRALLWTTDDGDTILDRVYSGNVQLARDRYAAWCRENDAYTCYEHLIGVSWRDGSVTLGPRAVDGRMVPYLDSFRYADRYGVFSTEEDGHCYDCQETDGSLGNTGVDCEDCGDRCDPDDMYAVGDRGVCENCFCNYSTCSRCEDVVHDDDTQSVCEETWCDYCVSHYSFRCDSCDERRPLMPHVCEGNDLCESCYEEKTCSCDGCGDDFYISSLVDNRCKSCQEETVEV